MFTLIRHNVGAKGLRAFAQSRLSVGLGMALNAPLSLKRGLEPPHPKLLVRYRPALQCLAIDDR